MKVISLSLIILTFQERYVEIESFFNGNSNRKSLTRPLNVVGGAEELTTDVENLLSTIPVGPPDAILGIAEAFRNCNNPEKVNICVGAYRDMDGKPWVLPCVRQAEKIMIDSNVNKEYAPIEGDAEFTKLALQFAYGEEANTDVIAGVQSLSGTGACRIGGAFYSSFLPTGTQIYIPDPTWGNHINIFKTCGLDVQRYRYYDREKNGLDYEGMVEDIQNAPSGSIILLHACAHNPTGCDPTKEQWKNLSNLILQKKHIVFFDSAYQGFASGDAEKDAYALRLFVSAGHKNIALAQSFAKNFGLYGERCGTFSIVCSNEEEKKAIMSQLKLIIRPMYSSPPIHGSSIVKTVLSDEELRPQYYEQCQQMAQRIQSMRDLLYSTLEQIGSTHDWSHITQQIGMFAYTGMSAEMCDRLTEEYSIFLTRDGRVSLAGLNQGNVEYVAKAIHEVSKGGSISSV